MATQKQIQANRSNAQLSTGPRAEQGKAISRMNALHHRNPAVFLTHLAELERRQTIRRQIQGGVDSSVSDSPQTENPAIGFVPPLTPNPAGPTIPAPQHAAPPAPPPRKPGSPPELASFRTLPDASLAAILPPFPRLRRRWRQPRRDIL